MHFDLLRQITSPQDSLPFHQNISAATLQSEYRIANQAQCKTYLIVD
jgi:hypothetical protein